jgi:hypothetical protein
MRSIYILILIFISPVVLFSQSKIKILKAGIGSVPGGVKYKGGMKDALRWKDDSGDNYAIICETGVYKGDKQDAEMETKDAEVYAFRYLMKGDNPETQWKIQDFEHDCPFDIVCSFLKNTFQVTDLNDNGIGEVWVMYKTTCTSDASPSVLKLIMYEGNSKYAMRGHTKIKFGEADHVGGDYKFDEAFNAAPKKIRDFALKLWDDNVVENWGK